MNATEIMEELRNGNKRFISKETKHKNKKPSDLAGGQSPHTIVLTCADSRVPPELIFDQDLGDLFVIRIAGNYATAEAIGSIEYAAANLGSSVIMILGHTSCGAVGAAVDVVTKDAELPSKSLIKTIDPILAAVQDAKKSDATDLLDTSVNNNVSNAAKELLKESKIIQDLESQKKIQIVNAKYHLDSGLVEYL